MQRSALAAAHIPATGGYGSMQAGYQEPRGRVVRSRDLVARFGRVLHVRNRLFATLIFGGLNGRRSAGSRSFASDGRAGRFAQNSQDGSRQPFAHQRSHARQNSAS